MSNPRAIVTSKHRTTGNATFRCSIRTEAHLDSTIAALTKQHPGARLQIIQGCYHNGPLSAGTHDYDAVLDFRIVGLGWWDGQRFLREHGWAAWYRHTGTWASPSAWHLHSISLGFTTKVGEYIDGGLSLTGHVYTSSQVADYYHHSLGLKGQHASGEDRSWFPPNIDATIFNFAAWEDDMPLSDDDVSRVADAVWERVFSGFGNLSAGSILVRIARKLGAK